jgi:biopolymer transport protein ExbD
MTEKGDFYWNKEGVDLAVAVSRLRQLKQSEADSKFSSTAMPRHIFGDIVAVLDEVRKVCITKVAIETANKK